MKYYVVYFNPTIVRLKQKPRLAYFVFPIRFQSYNSSIKTQLEKYAGMEICIISILQ